MISCCNTWAISPQKRTTLPVAVQWPKQLNASLEEVDPELYDIIEKEKNRQFKVCSKKGYSRVSKYSLTVMVLLL